MKSFLLLRAALFTALCAGLATSQPAAAKNWVGNTDANFNTAANWSPAAVPVSTDALVFTNAGSAGTTLTDNIPQGATDLGWNGISFTALAPSYTISGGRFALNSGFTIANNSGVLQTLNVDMGVNGIRTIDTGSGGLVLGGRINSYATTGGLTKNGAGTLTLSGGNVYVAATTISAGTLSLNTIANGGNGSATALVITSGSSTVTSSSASPTLNGLTVGMSIYTPSASGTPNAVPPSATVTGISGGAGAWTITLSAPAFASYTGSAPIVGFANSLGLSVNTAAGLVFSGSSTLQYTGPTARTDRGFTINAGVTATFDVTNAATDLTFASGPAAAATTGALIKTGAGRLTLTNTAFLYTGATTLSAGQLFIKGPTVGSLAAGSAVAVNAGVLGGNGELKGTVTVALSAGAVIVPGESNDVASATLKMGNLTLNGGNTLVYDLNSTAVAYDKIAVTGALTVNNNGTTTVVLANNPDLAVGDYDLITAGSLAGAGGLANFTLSATVPPTKIYTLVYDTGVKKLQLHVVAAGAVNYTWIGSTVSDWDIGSTANWSTTPPSPLVMYADATDVVFDDYGSAHTTVNLPAPVAPASVTVKEAANYTFSGSGYITGSGGLSKSGPSTLTISTTNDFTGTAVISGGTVLLNSVETPGSSGPLGKTGAINLQGGTLQYSALNTADYSSRFAAASSQVNIDTAGQSVTFAAGLPAAASLTKAGSGTLVLSAANTNSGALTINDGILQLSSGSDRLKSSSAVIIANAAGAVLDLNGNAQRIGSLAGTGPAGTVALGGNLLQIGDGFSSTTYGGVISGAGGLLKQGVSSLTLSGVLGFSGSLTGNAGMLTLSGANTFGGGVNSSGSTINLNSSTALGAGTLTINGGTLDNTSGSPVTQANNNPVSWNGNFTFTGTGDLNLGTGAVTLNGNRVATVNSNSLTMGGVISGNPGDTITKQGTAGTLVLAGLNTFSDQIQINNGTVAANTIFNAGTDSSLGNGSTTPIIRIGNSFTTGTLAYNGGATSTDRQIQVGNGSTAGDAGSATVNNNGSGALVFANVSFNAQDAGAVIARTLTLGGSNTNNNEVQGVITDNAAGGKIALVKSDAGLWKLSGTNTYSGSTTVNGGTLLLNGTIGSGTVTVATNGTLAGVGTIGGAVTVANGGKLAPGDNVIGILNLSSNLTLNSGSTTLIKINKSSATNDVIITGGTNNYGGTLTVVNLGGTPALGDTYQLFNAAAHTGLFATTNLPALSGNLKWTWNSASGSLTVAATTTVSLGASVAPSTYGQSVIFTATVQTNSVTLGNAVSNVVFKVDGITMTTVPVTGGSAAYSTSALRAGVHTVTADYTGGGNYLPSTGSVTQTVNQATLTITANNLTKPYDGVPFSGGNGVTYAGFVNGETNAALGGTLSYGGTSQGATAVSSYTIIPSGLTNAVYTNYNIGFVSGTLVITAAGPVTNNIVLSAGVGSFSLTWPVLGWYAQSNSVNVADTNYWFDIAGSQAATNLSVTINPGLSNVFYRLRAP